MTLTGETINRSNFKLIANPFGRIGAPTMSLDELAGTDNESYVCHEYSLHCLVLLDDVSMTHVLWLVRRLCRQGNQAGNGGTSSQ